MLVDDDVVVAAAAAAAVRVRGYMRTSGMSRTHKHTLTHTYYQRMTTKKVHVFTNDNGGPIHTHTHTHRQTQRKG